MLWKVFRVVCLFRKWEDNSYNSTVCAIGRGDAAIPDSDAGEVFFTKVYKEIVDCAYFSINPNCHEGALLKLTTFGKTVCVAMYIA